MPTESRQWFILGWAAAFFWLTYQLAPVITPFVLAAALAFLADPLVDKLQRIRIGRWQVNRTLAVVLVFLLLIVLITLFLLIVIPLLHQQLVHLIERIPVWAGWMGTTVLPWLQQKLGIKLSAFDPAVISEALKADWKELSSAMLGVLGTVSRGGQAFVGWIINLFLVPVVGFYLLRDWDLLIEGIRALLPREIEPTISRLAKEIEEVLGAFIRGQLMVMFALGLMYAVGLWMVGLDLAFIIGMGAGLLSIVPYLGTIVGLLAALVAAVHPVVVIFAVLAGGQLFGFLGVLLALPAASALNVLVRHANQRYLKSDLYQKEKPLQEKS
jgi:predicted PurR-regulated permease PerM